MGICFSCTQVKTSGCTRNIRTGETDSDPDTEIQLCINVPVGDVDDSNDLRRRIMTITLTESQVDELGRELDAIRARVVADLGTEDRDYIYKVVKAQRGLEVAGRAALFLGFLPPFWLAGTAALSLSKILDNMEIGHNVMHGQYDWMRDPALNSKMFEWDTVCPSDQWRHSHNYMHHTFTNILGKDRDIGYGVLRMDEAPEVESLLPGQPGVGVPADDALPVRRRGARSRGREHHQPASARCPRTRRCSRASGARSASRRSRTTCCSPR